MRLIFLFAVTLAFTACRKKTNTKKAAASDPKVSIDSILVKCNKTLPNLNLSGFNQEETDTLFLETFANDGSFKKPVRSILLMPEKLDNYGLSPDSNFILYIPGAGRSFQIKDITIPETSQLQPVSEHQSPCYSYPTSITVNGKIARVNDTTGILTSNYLKCYIFIRK